MSAYVVVHGTIKDKEKMQAYGKVAGPSVASHGGEVVCRGPSEALAGVNAHTLMVVLKFPDQQAARDWYNSPEYQAIVPTREAAMEAVFVIAGD
ncbi:MAG: DUF1330 domain-containing protein [Gammaproteobacteria bacterium]|nr:DUF1330 domain-containing protein [Gammaproteobacteria bacterium]